jgi:hypothetical protein|tara:strand:- start:8 stop:265 length:258 start_codon:yes stop_codon:yes gene_type:complete
MKKTIFIILTSILLTNCAYRPLINPETSRDKHSGENISGGYWKDLHACRYVHKQNTNKLMVALKISDEYDFVKHCMKEYGYSVLR